MRTLAFAFIAALGSAQDLSRELPGVILDIHNTPINRDHQRELGASKGVIPGIQSNAVLLAFSVNHVPAALTHRIRFQAGDNREPLTVEQPGTSSSRPT